MNTKSARPSVGAQKYQPARLESREQIKNAKRIVVKIGSSSLTLPSGELDRNTIWELANQISKMVKSGKEIILVSSGAIAAALRPLGLKQRPENIKTQQAVASVGQGKLVANWSAAFEQNSVLVGQVLLTERDVIEPATYRNVKDAIEELLAMKIVPIINENDSTATREIRFGDNDRLASLVAQAVGADLLVLLTDVDGLYTKPPQQEGAERIPLVPDAAKLKGVCLSASGSSVGTGGMVTKLSAAYDAAITGTATCLVHTANFHAALRGADYGTFFPAGKGRRRSRLMWLKYATKADGEIVLDQGALAAVLNRPSSILPVGIKSVKGSFAAGMPVDIKDSNDRVVARGLSYFSESELKQILGLTLNEIKEKFGEEFSHVAIHRDDLVILVD